MRAWLYRAPGQYVCENCHKDPHLWELNGFCEGPTRLPVLVGNAVSACPTWMGLCDEDVQFWSSVVLDWSKAPGLGSMPSRARSLVRLWTGWEAERRAQEEQQAAAAAGKG